tara:strand:- start:41 stop:1162 length:1122 start_codon:yes stop_codon:yes gene_type:complete
MDNENANIIVFFEQLFGRNSDPGNIFRKDADFCNIAWVEGLKNKTISNNLRGLQSTPISSLYARTILNRKFDEDLIEAAINTSKNLTRISEGNYIINLDYAPDSIRYLPILNQFDIKCLESLFNIASAKSLSVNGGKRLEEITNGKFNRISLFRIMKTASTSIEEALRLELLGKGPYESCHNGIGESIMARLGKNGIVESSWNPLACATEAYNLFHSHYPINEFRKCSERTYSVISFREPIDRICSFINSFLKIPISSSFFSSIEDCIENCHPDWIHGQLYYCSQDNNLQNAKRNLRDITRVLIAEDSDKWGELIRQDINVSITTNKVREGKYQYKDELRKSVEHLISKDTYLSKKIDEEYELYRYACELSNK